MANIPVPFYYDQFSAKERSYIDYMGELTKITNNQIESSANRQIAANALFATEIKETLISNQIATENALYNHTQQINNTLSTGFSGVTRQIGEMGSSMNMGLACLNSSVQESSDAICKKLDDINETLKNPLFTQARELYNRALQRYNKGFYEEALKDLHEAIKKNETDPFSYFLLGQTYLFGISEFSNAIDLDASIEALKNAAKYITPDAKNHNEARPMAAEIWFYLGLAYHTKANDDLHNSNKTDCEKNLNEAKTAYKRSWDYSQNMLESLYNLARSKVLTNDEAGAIQDLISVMLKDHEYCLKTYTESDFDNKFKNKLFGQLKRKIYPEVKTAFDRIGSIKTDFQGPYSNDLGKLINTHFPNTFNEDTPPYDMLKAGVSFQNILFIFEKEYAEHLNIRKARKQIADDIRIREERKPILAEIRKKLEKYKKCISAGGYNTVGLKSDGTVVVAGDNEFGQRNTGEWRNIVAVCAGLNVGYTVGLKADGNVVAVGGYKGKGHEYAKDLRNVIAISAGQGIVSLKSDGTVVYGANLDNLNSWYDIVDISAGFGHTVGLKKDGTVVTNAARSSYFEDTKSWRDIVAVCTGDEFTAGLKADGTVVVAKKIHDVKSWNDIAAISFESWRDIVAISAGYSHIAGLKADGTVVVAGCNHDVESWRDIVAISAGVSLTIGLKADGSVVAVGSNEKGQCNTGSWQDIGPVSDDLVWKWKGLCRFCGGQISGLFSKKCKSCGKQN